MNKAQLELLYKKQVEQLKTCKIGNINKGVDRLIFLENKINKTEE